MLGDSRNGDAHTVKFWMFLDGLALDTCTGAHAGTSPLTKLATVTCKCRKTMKIEDVSVGGGHGGDVGEVRKKE